MIDEKYNFFFDFSVQVFPLFYGCVIRLSPEKTEIKKHRPMLSSLLFVPYICKSMYFLLEEVIKKSHPAFRKASSRRGKDKM